MEYGNPFIADACGLGKSSSVKVRVRLFSILRDRAGASELDLDLEPRATVAEAVKALGRTYPGIEGLQTGPDRLPILCAVNREFAQQQVRLKEGDELALMPPVSGGSMAVAADTKPLLGLLLLSGGFDSPVAGHMVQAGGRTLEALHFTMEPFTDDASVHKARRLAGRLGLARLHVVPLGEDLAVFTRNCDHRYYFVLLKRLMLRVADAVADRLGASFLLTGENLGQVSSQTLPNLGVIDAVARRPVLRPLLGLDKDNIIGIARRIGTFETSKGPELCDVLGPRHPVTFSTQGVVVAEEAKVEIDRLVANALSKLYVATPTLDDGPLADAAACP